MRRPNANARSPGIGCRDSVVRGFGREPCVLQVAPHRSGGVRRYEKLPLEQSRLIGRRGGPRRPHVRRQMVVIAAGREEQRAWITPHLSVEPERAMIESFRGFEAADV